MNVQSLTGEFKLFVDPMYYGYQWTEAQYVTIEYTAAKRGNDIGAAAQNVKGQPWLIGSIAVRNNWMEFSREIDAATLDHATKHFNRNSHVNETILGSIAAHITH